MAAIVGTGIAITFQSGFFAEIIGTDWESIERAVVQSSHAASTNNAHTYIPGDLVDWGDLEVQIHYDPDQDLGTVMQAAAETITITLKTGATVAFPGFARQMGVAMPFEDKMTCRVALKVAGDPTFTAAP